MFWRVAFLLVAVVGCHAEPVDVLFTGGHVGTAAAEVGWRVDAIAVRDGKIVAIGPVADLQRYRATAKRIVELDGRRVIAALTDAHGHLTAMGQGLTQADLRGCESPVACAERLRPLLKTQAEGTWIRGRGWDHGRFVGNTDFPMAAALDAVAPHHPVWLRRIDGHAAWANTLALTLAHIDATTPDPPGGRIIRDAAGKPTGVLIDGAVGLVERMLPPLTVAQRAAAILAAQQVLLTAGYTSVHDMWIDADSETALRQLAASGQLQLRVVGYAGAGGLWSPLDMGELDRRLATAPDKHDASDRFAMVGIKLFADGTLGSRGAALADDYSDAPGERGTLMMTPAVLTDIVQRAVAHGWQLAVHAIGDAAARLVLDAYAAGGAAGHRFRMEHAQVLAPSDLARFTPLGVIASMQPSHATGDAPWAQMRLGAERITHAYAWSAVRNSGARLAFGSDFPVEPPSLTASVAAGTHCGEVQPERCVSEGDVLEGHSAGAAYAAHEEAFRGHATVGQVADLTVFTPDLQRADLVMIGGKVVFERP